VRARLEKIGQLKQRVQSMPIVGIDPSRGRITGKFADLPSGEEVDLKLRSQVVSSSVVSSVNSPFSLQDETGTIQLYLIRKESSQVWQIAIQMLSTTSSN